MHWNNRIFKKEIPRPDGEIYTYYEMHETFYDGDKLSWTVDAKKPFGESVDELIECLEQMLKDAKKSKDDILNYED